MDSGNLLLTVLYITVMKTSESSQSSACDPGWNHFGASCYLFSSTIQTWEEAKVSCEGLNSYLAEIETSEENEELTRIAQQQVVVGTDQGWWIGLTDMTTEGTFIWNNSGSLLSFEDWGTAQPDDAGPATYYNCDCVRIADYLIQVNNPKVWTDFKCTFDNYYICERDVECLGDKNVENAIIRSYSGNSVNDVVLYTCALGFELTDGSLTRTCTENGTWSDPPVCSSAVCECLCSSTTHYSVLSQEQLEEQIQRMHSELVVSKNDTSKFKRSKISAPDDRVTAKTTGFVLGFGLLTALFAFILISDISSYHRFSQQCAFKRN